MVAPLHESKIARLRSLVSGGMSKAAAAREVGVARATVIEYCQDLEPGSPPDEGPVESLEEEKAKRTFRKNGDEATLEFRSDRIPRNDREMIEAAGVDEKVWQVKDWETGAYQVTLKLQSREVVPAGVRRIISEQPHTVTMYRIKVRLKRLVSEPIEKALDRLYERMRERAKPGTAWKPRKVRAVAVEALLCDAHFGKLCWAPEVGRHYDLSIAEQVYRSATDDILNDIKGQDVEEVVFPIGNDLFHVDAEALTTTSGTKVDTDGRYAKIVEAVYRSVELAVRRWLEVANRVRLFRVPGNHDRQASLHLIWYLEAVFRNEPRVSVSLVPKDRQVWTHGVNALMFTHGSDEPWPDLVNIFATEFADAWGPAKHREVHVGHGHRRRKFETMPVEEHRGCVVRMIPALCPTDAWHYRKGYIGTSRAAEAFLWDRELGYRGHFVANVRDEA